MDTNQSRPVRTETRLLSRFTAWLRSLIPNRFRRQPRTNLTSNGNETSATNDGSNNVENNSYAIPGPSQEKYDFGMLFFKYLRGFKFRAQFNQSLLSVLSNFSYLLISIIKIVLPHVSLTVY